MSPSAKLDSNDRFAHLDGLRGLAALFVLLHHAYVEVAWTKPGLPPALQSILYLFTQGTRAVDVFIVLSGFVLMMPVIRGQDGSLRDGLRGFFKRRARRILPPYYGALIASLLLIALVPMMRAISHDRWDDALPAFSFNAIASHLLLIHNFSRQWIWKIDNPMWSVATEWQIYFVFAVVLLPIWRRLGMRAAVCAGLTIGAVIEFFMPPDSEACFHFIGLFAFGMAAAQWVAKNRRVTNLNAISCIGCFGMIALLAGCPLFTEQPKIAVDLVVGIATAVTIACTASLEVNGRSSVIGKLLSAKPVRRLGEFSYSLYLMHFPLLALGSRIIRTQLNLNPVATLLLLTFAIVPIVIAGCFGFHLIFEKPFLRQPSNRREVVPVNGSGNISLAA